MENTLKKITSINDLKVGHRYCFCFKAFFGPLIPYKTFIIKKINGSGIYHDVFFMYYATIDQYIRNGEMYEHPLTSLEKALL